MRHRVLIVGVGSIGERHLRCFLATGRAELGFVEVNDSLRTTIAERYAVGHTWADLEAALRRREQVALQHIAQEEARALAEVRAVAVDLAVQVAGRLIAERLDAAKSDALIDDAITQLPGKLN